MINDRDQFKKIAKRFVNAVGKYFGEKLYEEYEDFVPYKRITFNDLCNKEHNPLDFLNEILIRYQQMVPLFVTNNLIDPAKSSFITIQPNAKDIQECLNQRINLQVGEFINCPEILVIKIEQTDGKKLDFTEVDINETIQLKIQDENEIEIEETYCLNSLIVLRCGCPVFDHFISIVLKGDKIFYCDNAQILQGIPRNHSMSAIKKKRYILLYCKTSPEMVNQQYLNVPFSSFPPSKDNNTDPLHKPINPPETVFPVTSKIIKKTKPIDVPIGEKNGEKEIQLDIEIKNDALHFTHVAEHDTRTRINLHEEYKYLYGYLGINGEECIHADYNVDDPMYKSHAILLERFVSIICNFVYKTAADIGAINANTTAEALGMNVCNSLNEQVKEVSSEILRCYYDLLCRKNCPSDSEIEGILARILGDFIVTGKKLFHDEDGNIEDIHIPLRKRSRMYESFEKSIPSYPNGDYDWKERIDSLGLNSIMEAIQSKHGHAETVPNDKTTNLRKKFWDDYQSQRKKFKTDKEFVKSWCEKRSEMVAKGELTFSESTALKLLSEFKANEGITETKKRPGIAPKITDQSRLCLLSTVMDYPFLTDKERTDFLNKYGPIDQKPVTEKTVNNELNKMDLHVKTPAFSPKERNTFGFWVARCLWGNVISDIMQNKKVITCFIDEAGVKKSPPKNSRGYISVSPVVTGDYSKYNDTYRNRSRLWQFF